SCAVLDGHDVTIRPPIFRLRRLQVEELVRAGRDSTPDAGQRLERLHRCRGPTSHRAASSQLWPHIKETICARFYSEPHRGEVRQACKPLLPPIQHTKENVLGAKESPPRELLA